MSIDVKDHRRYSEGKLAESLKAAEERVANKNAELLPQAPSDLANTGNEQFDKLLRGIQELVNVAEAHKLEVAAKAVSCVQEELFRMQQFEFFYTQGKLHAYAEVAKIPERIIAEAKPSLHVV